MINKNNHVLDTPVKLHFLKKTKIRKKYYCARKIANIIVTLL